MRYVFSDQKTNHETCKIIITSPKIQNQQKKRSQSLENILKFLEISGNLCKTTAPPEGKHVYIATYPIKSMLIFFRFI